VTRRALACVLACALLAAGAATAATAAGGSPASATKPAPAYTETMKRLGDELGAAMQGIYPLVTGAPGSVARSRTIERLKKADTALKGIEARMGKVAPPKAVRSQHRRLLRQVEILRGELGGMIESLHDDRLGAFVKLSNLDELYMIWATARKIDRKGYDILGSG
jgi:predicted secreted protein